MGKIYTVTDGKTGQKKYPVTLFDAVIDGNGKKLTNRIGEDEAEIERLDEECVKAREVENVELNQGGNLVIVEDNLVSTNTNTALSANQGRVLKELIDSIPQGGGGGSSSGGASVNVVDNLLSTSSTSALSANQGRVLKGLVDGKQDKITATNKLSYSLLSGTPTIPDAVTEQTVEEWGFTKNNGTYSKPLGGIPKTDLASDVQTLLDKVDSIEDGPDDTNLVHLNNSETISGVKTFTGGNEGSNPSVVAKFGVSTGGTDVTVYTGMQSHRKCADDSNIINTAGFIVNSDGTSKFVHRRGSTTAVSVKDDAYITFDALGGKIAYSGTKGTAVADTQKYTIIDSKNISDHVYSKSEIDTMIGNIETLLAAL